MSVEQELLEIERPHGKEECSVLNAKKNKLISLAYSVLKNPLYQQELELLMTKLGLNETEVIRDARAWADRVRAAVQ